MPIVDEGVLGCFWGPTPTGDHVWTQFIDDGRGNTTVHVMWQRTGDRLNVRRVRFPIDKGTDE